jgi:3-(3-hydroxy-phenyl)propionate hydroxylase
VVPSFHNNMTEQDRVLIAGAGPVGLTAAASLVHGGVPVTVLEAGSALSTESRASTFHPPTLDMLDRLGAAAPLIAQGLVAPRFQYRSKRHGVIGAFDFAAIADATGHPYRLQSEQLNLTRILYERLRGDPLFQLQFDCAVAGVAQSSSGVEVTADAPRPARGDGSSAPTGLAARCAARSASNSRVLPGRSVFWWSARRSTSIASFPTWFRSPTWPIRNAGISCCRSRACGA